MVLIRGTRDKERLTHLKLDIVDLLTPLKSDKYRPVREIAAECLHHVKQIPDPMSSRQNGNTATFSPNHNAQKDINELMHNFMQENGLEPETQASQRLAPLQICDEQPSRPGHALPPHSANNRRIVKFKSKGRRPTWGAGVSREAARNPAGNLSARGGQSSYTSVDRLSAHSA
jgi:hypothetical protein